MEKKFKRTLVTTALPYANGPVHIGHLAGVYVPADIYTRYLRLKGEDVIMIGGSDEHGVPITIKAKAEGVTPQDIVDRYHNIIKKSFEEFGISFDIYSRTTSDIHSQMASDFFRKLYDKGEFIEKTSMQYYDEEANQFLADRYITGTCPHCGNERAYGDQCEACGTSLNATDLINPKSAITGNKPVLRETKHWYLPLDKWEPFLRQWILEEHKEWKPNVYGQCKSWLDMGLQPRAVSRDLDWGVPVPVEGAEGKVLYVWFDAPIGYISNTKELLPDKWELYWKDSETKMVHFIGKDNIVFHCIVFPAMLKAEGSYILPDNVPANEFLNLEGDKISTSRNWAVWLHEYLEEFPGKQDVLRYVLTANAPETKDNDFTWKDFQARNNNELVAILGNFVNRALVLTHKYFEGKVPEAGELTDYDRDTLKEFVDVKASVENYLDHYRFRDLFELDLSRYKCIFFLNAFLFSAEEWASLSARIAPDACLVWHYAPGIFSPEYDPDAVHEKCGFFLKRPAESLARTSLIPDGGFRDCPVLRREDAGNAYPYFILREDASLRILGRLDNGDAVIGETRHGGRRNLYISLPLCTWPYYRRIMEESGVLFYAPPETTVYADSRFIGLFPRKDVRFPPPFPYGREIVFGGECSGTLRIEGKGVRVFLPGA